MEEIWKPIPLLDGYYEASNLGQIRRAKPGRGTRVGLIVKGSSRVSPGSGKKYRTLIPSCGKKGHRVYSFAALVLDAFGFKRPSPDHEPDHINRDTLNNSIDNIQWLHWTQNRPGRPRKST
jgi:hypothetical protein